MLFIQADKNLEYAKVQDALAQAAASGARVVGMIAERRPDRRVGER